MNETAYALYESAQRLGLLHTLSPFGYNLVFNIPFSKSFCQCSIDELNLSVRSGNGLMRANLSTVGKLLEAACSEEGLSKIRNLGKKSISEIKTSLLVHGYERMNDRQRLCFWTDFVRDNNVGGAPLA